MEVVDRARLLAIVAAQGDLTKVCVSHITDMKNAASVDMRRITMTLVIGM